MIALILFAFVQDPSIDERIEAYLKGDAAARTEIVKLGAVAIRPLQKAREKGPDKIDALVFELKKGAAYPKSSSIPEQLTGRGVLTVRDQELETILPLLQSQGLAVVLDRFDPSEVKSTKVSFEKLTKSREILDQICRQTGLDYGFFHNHVVLGTPDRLWPSGPPAKPVPLKGDELAKAKALVEKLCDDAIEAREAATGDLMKLGPSVIPVLEANLGRKEAEIVTRCSAMIERLRAVPRGAFGPSGAERQKKTHDEEKGLKHIQTMKMSLNFNETTLEDIMGFLKEFSGVPIELQGEAGKQVCSIQTRDQLMGDLLSLVTQSRDLDYAFKEGKVVIDTREEIEKILKGPK